RIGSLLRRAWQAEPPAGLAVQWHARQAGPGADLVWDVLGPQPAPLLAPGAVVLNLTGVTAGDAAALAANVALGRAVQAQAGLWGARAVLHLSSAAVYAGHPRHLADETDEPAPPGPYGQAKLAMEHAVRALGGPPATMIRLGNVAGADALLGRAVPPVALDPVPGLPRGPLRSYIGPQSLGRALACLCRQATTGAALPLHLNLAQAPEVAMADLLDAAGLAWHWAPPNPRVLPRAVMAVARLAALCPLPPADPARMVAEWRQLRQVPA
ncbi:MAG: sugar nucleotide-binding protein, partial [Rhodobacterales bacterium]|nr:sugar nucleotide-binding protein [Rhodobacterales bacterium]